jgi:signal transduction histidine kinase
MRHKLYLQIYLVFFIGIILFSATIAVVVWKQNSSSEFSSSFISGMTVLVSKAFPEDASAEETQDTIEQLATGFKVQLSLYSDKQQHLISSHNVLPLPQYDDDYHHESSQRGLFALPISAGRKLVIYHQKPNFPAYWVSILLLMLMFAIAAYPLARRLTSRLELLKQQVDAFGAGDLSARSEIKGKDEIAALAKRFNYTAERIEQLIEAQKEILAGASHELRTPLTRMRLAVELMDIKNVQQTQQKLRAYIAEQDNLVDELLLASKLENNQGSPLNIESIDILALVAEESCSYHAEVSGESILINGNEFMLKRVLRNLLENADRHRNDQAISINVINRNNKAVITICDDGPGIEVSEQQRIFEPFYQARSKNNKSGSIGLGLSLVQKIVAHHQGSIRYINQAGTGACFEINLPID